jgi:DNA-binding MltR family transcriptional regulator
VTNELAIRSRSDVALTSGIDAVLQQIRPEWVDRSLIQRVKKLLPVDPSSACQRIFNAAIHDIRQKIVVAGLDIADEAADRYRLPRVTRAEDILETYSVSHVIDLAYRMGILLRPEWRRLSRCYEIRRDLEHEDDQYEATDEDIVYIFKTCVEVVLKQDPFELLRVDSVKQLIDRPDRATASAELLKNYEMAPDTRQIQIIELLINTALDSGKADITRQNAMEMLRHFKPVTHNTAKIELASFLQKRITNKRINLITAKIAYASGTLPYLKQRQVEEFFGEFFERFKGVGTDWTRHGKHSPLLEDFEDVGGLVSVPQSLRKDFVLWLTRCYLGEPGGYGKGINRKVFYSDTAALPIEGLFKEAGKLVEQHLQDAVADTRIQAALQNRYIARRFEMLMDIVSGGAT